MIRNTFRSLAILLCLAVAGIFLCTKNPVVHNPLPNTGKTSNGYFYILSPTTGDSIAFDSTITITWAPSQNVNDTAHVRIYLYNDTHQVCVISPSSLNTGSLTWAAPNSGAGTKYHVKICVLADSQHFDFGNYFSFYDPYDGTITITKPDSSNRLILDSSFTIQWTSTGFSGASLKLCLYDDTALVSTIVDRMIVSVHSYSWSTITTTHGSGTKYRIKATSDYDTSIYDYSQYFTIASEFWGGFTVKVPSDSSVWTSGNTYKIQWDTSGHPGPFVLLQLYNDSVVASTIASVAPDSGSFSWPIPLTATSGTKYRIKITSTGDASISAFSKKFTIKGIDPDSYEPDNVRDSASALTLGTVQSHTITLNDTDWVRFTADSGSRYIIVDSGYASFQTAIPLFYSKENTFTSYNFAGSSGLLRWMWSCEKSGTYYTRISSLVGGNTGGYSFRISAFDPATSVIFTAPVSSTTIAAGSSFSVTWSPDSAILGTSVYIYLYKGNNQLTAVTASSVPDNGSYSWSVSAGLASGSDYRIKIANANNSLFYGLSRSFTLTGMTPDTFEYDDIRDSASLLSLGVAQQHSITMNDTDWIRLAPDSGSTYLFQVKGASSFQTAINLFHGIETGMSSLKNSDTSGSAQWLWVCDKPAPWYARINATAGGGYGTYSFKMTKFDSLSSITFANPTASSKWFGAVSYTIAWTPDTGLLGNAVSLRLVKAGIASSALSVTSAPNSGTYSWTVPATVTPGIDYRIRIANSGNTQLFGLSPQFTLSDVMPDSFEVDDSRTQASTITLGTAQQHSLTSADTDWIKFSVDSGSRYVFVANGSAGYRVSGALYYNTNTTSEVTFTSGTNGIAQSLWACAKSGTYYSKIFSYTASATGRYSFGVQVYDSSTIAPFASPAAGVQWSTDSTYTIRWTADTALFGRLVLLYAYKTDLLSATITAASVSNTGTYSWTVSSGMSSGADYRIRIVNAGNTQLYGFSPVFSIKGITPDSYEPDNPRNLASALVFGTTQQHTITYSDTDWIKFSADSGSVYVIRDTGASAFRTYVYLYYTTDQISTASNLSLTTGTFVWAWPCMKTGTYYARVTPYTAGTAGAYSFTMTKFDTLASITFTGPVSTSTFTAGNSNTISWVPDTSILGTSAYLYLYKGGQLLSTISASYIPNSGTYSWASSPGLITGNDYRIKIASYANSKVYGYSAAFTINGLTPDSYEPDNIRSQASTLTMGTAQPHSITVGDTDWVQFAADSGSVYVVKDSGASLFRTYVYLYYGTDVSYTSMNNASTAGVLKWYWTCVKSGTYYARIHSYTAGSYGNYSFKVSLFDPSSSITFTIPLATTTWTAGATNAINWVPDSSILGTYAYLYVFKGSQQLATITPSSVSNNGIYSWSIPSGFATGNDYRIKIANYTNTFLAGYSPVFSITGMTADSYEPDNIRSQATTLTSSASQQHTITYNDTDWVRFTADSGSTVTIRDSGMSSFRTDVSLFFGTDASSTVSNSSGAGGILSWAWKCVKTGAWYARITPSTAGAGGSYSFSMVKFDTLVGVSFTNPTTTSTWNAGSSYTIGWVPDTGTFGTSVSLSVYKGFQYAAAITTSTQPNTGSFTWALPAGFATGADYRIRIAPYGQTGTYGYSPAFSISGLAPDAFENDNSRSSAPVAVLGSLQQRTLTYLDTDWVRFTGESGSLYIIQTTSSSSYLTDIDIFDETSTNFYFSDYPNANGILSRAFQCAYTGTLYCRIKPHYTSIGYGPYTFRLAKFDTLNSAAITYPTAGAVLTSGNTYTVTWRADSVFFDSVVSIDLFKGSTYVTSVLTAYSARNNTGSSAWVVHQFPSGNDYHMRLASSNTPGFAVNGPVFSISGATVTADSYEPDNQQAGASLLTLGATQQHTITFGDSDNVRFSADSGSSYLITGSCGVPFYFYCEIYSGTPSYLDGSFVAQGATYSFLWNCTRTGPCILLYQSLWIGTVGTYSVKVTKQ